MKSLLLVLLAIVAQVSLAAAPAISPIRSAGTVDITLDPTSVTGGAPVIGTITLSEPAPVGGAEVVLSSSNPFAASVPASVIVPEGATTTTFMVATSPVGTTSNVMIAGIYAGVAGYAMLSVNPTPVADSVAITKASYDLKRHVLKVEATSSSSTATLSVYEKSSGALIGTLSKKGNRYTGTFSRPVNPITIVVSSSQGGSATATVGG